MKDPIFLIGYVKITTQIGKDRVGVRRVFCFGQPWVPSEV